MKTLIPTTPPPSFKPDELVATVGNLRQTSPSELLVPHFGIREDVNWVFDRTVELVRSWLDQVEGFWKNGSSLDEISEKMEAEVLGDAEIEDLPIYAKVSVRTSVMGILNYLEKNA
jgi:hypothetical protein